MPASSRILSSKRTENSLNFTQRSSRQWKRVVLHCINETMSGRALLCICSVGSSTPLIADFEKGSCMFEYVHLHLPIFQLTGLDRRHRQFGHQYVRDQPSSIHPGACIKFGDQSFIDDAPSEVSVLRLPPRALLTSLYAHQVTIHLEVQHSVVSSHACVLILEVEPAPV